MGWFSCFRSDTSKHDIRTAMEISRYEEEDRIVRRRREEEDENFKIEKVKNISLEEAKKEEAKRRLEESSEDKGKRKQVEDDQELGETNMDTFKDKEQTTLSKDEDVNPPPSGCKSETGISVNPQCSCCLLCHKLSPKKGHIMPISDVASLVGGAALGAPVSEILKLVIEETKNVNDFKSLFQDLASRMEVLVPVLKDIESMQGGGRGELKKVLMIMERADEMVRKCSSVQPYNLLKRSLYASQIKGINQDFLRFCQIELPLIQYRNQLQSMGLMASVNTQILTLYNGLPLAMNPPYSITDGCSFTVDHGTSVNVLSVLCPPECLICLACDKPIAVQEVENYVSNSRGKFHKSCYKRYCYVCKEKKIKRYCRHPFWGEIYCHSHEADGTPKCHSCERLEPWGTNFVKHDDGRWQCLECMNSAVMDSDECQPLHFDMFEFFEALNMKIEKEFPFFLVEKQALNKAEKEEKIDYPYEVVIRGSICCSSEEQIIKSVSKGPRIGPNKRLVGMATESQRVGGGCEVTAILIMYGMPRLLTGYILAHEMMHAYLRLNGYRNLNQGLEEGICQVVGHMWLESQTYATADAIEASSSSSPTPAANASEKSEWSDFEKTLLDFCKNQIETDESPVFGDGFRKVNHMVKKSGLKETLKEILRWG